MILEFWVGGFPRPKGSLAVSSAVGSTRVRVREQIDPEGIWRGLVLREAMKAGREAGVSLPIRGPVGLKALFLFERPIDPEFDVPATIKTGDLDKLVRNVFDAITPRKAPEKARIVIDDARFVNLEADADYARDGESEGAFVQIFEGVSTSRVAFDEWRMRMYLRAAREGGGLFG